MIKLLGYYEVLEIVEELDKNNVPISSKEICNHINITDRNANKHLTRLVNNGLVQRRLIYCREGKKVIYLYRKENITEGFINDFFKVITNLIR